MAGINQLRNPHSPPDFENEANSALPLPTESTRRQHDRNFFEKFLRSSTDDQRSQIEMDPSDLYMGEPSSSASRVSNQSSSLHQLLPQANQTSLLGSNPYTMNPLYSAFGMSMNYEPVGNNSLNSTSSLNQSSLSPIYNNFNLNTDPNSYNESAGVSFFNDLNNQPNTSDSSNLFSGNSNLSSDGSRNLFDNAQSKSTELGKTYSSVLHSSSRRNLNSWQQQQQAAGALSLFDIQHNHCDFSMGQSGQQPIQDRGNINKQLQVMNESDLSLNEFLLGQSNRQDLAVRPAATHHSYQQTKQTSLTGAQHRSALTTASSSSSITFQQAVRSRPQELNSSEKAVGPNNSIIGGASTGQRRRNRSPFFNVRNNLGQGQPGFKLDAHGTGVINSDESERFSRKVFVGGLPPDIDEEEIKASFTRFGSLVVDWPHKAESKSYFPPKGYAFLLFQEESSVQSLIDSCYQEEDKLYLCVSSPTIKDKPVQIRPWRLSDSDFVLDSTLMLDPRKTVFVGGVPRPLKASELATIMNNLYGGVCYVGIDTDPELKYPKGAGRVAFSNHKSYIAAISARFVHIHHSEIEKRVEVKPYVLDDQFCDECQGSRCNNKFAPLFCANITCLRYYCESCWSTVHTQSGKEFHKPLVKECGDRPRGGQSFKW